MSLSLIQSYSSAEEDEEDKLPTSFTDEEDEDDDDDDQVSYIGRRHSQSQEPSPNPSTTTRSLLPSAFDAFSEVAGPPDFLNNCVAEHVLPEDNDSDDRASGRGRRRNSRHNKDLPAGVVMEAKAQLVGIRERVRSDIDEDYKSTSSVPSQKGPNSTVPGEGKRMVSATLPDAKDASELLRMCLQCGIPKTFSNARGMVCPVCGDRPPVDPDKESDKKKGSTIKDKEKNKRMKGQSSHATWKSETEMQLRQQFD